ncbi:MAG: peptidase-C39 like family protein [Thermodesulfobacteriota bacterium]
MEAKLHLDILPQPDDSACGPTCLHAVYRYWGDVVPLRRVIAETPKIPGGGTLAVLLACHALRRGYRATIYTFDLRVLDPTWFADPGADIPAKLAERMAAATRPKVRLAAKAYRDYLALGGELRFQDLTVSLLRRLLKNSLPVLTGLSATYLYRTAREREEDGKLVYDDVAGEPAGHFVVVCGYDMERRQALVADPLLPNPMSQGQVYEVDLNRLSCAILLGSLTYDANLLVIQPGPAGKAQEPARPSRADSPLRTRKNRGGKRVRSRRHREP